MWNWLRRILKVQINPDIADLDEDIEELYLAIEELETRQKAFELEIWEYIDGTLQPLHKRMATRLRRQEKDINSEEASEKKGGIISLGELKRRGYYPN